MIPRTAAAPAMSYFIRSIPSEVLRSSPPESNVMPLPISAMRFCRRPGGVYGRWMNLGDPELLDGALGLVLLVAVEGVRAEERALDEGLRALAGGQPVAQDLRGDGAGAEVARAAQRRSPGATQHFERRLGTPAEPGHDHATLARVDVRDLSRLRPEPLGL